MRLMKAKQLPMAAIAGADPAIFCWVSGGGGPNFGSERTVELFLWQVTSPIDEWAALCHAHLKSTS